MVVINHNNEITVVIGHQRYVTLQQTGALKSPIILYSLSRSTKRTCEVNRRVKIGLLFFSFYIKIVLNYDFKLVWVVLHPSVEAFFKKIHSQEQNNDAYS